MKNSFKYGLLAAFFVASMSFSPTLSHANTTLDANSVTLDYYLPQDVTYNPAIPTPASVLGFEVGHRHVFPEQIVAYMYALAEASDRVTVEEYAKSHGLRPLLLVTFSSPENIRNIETIRENHVKLSDPAQSGNANISNMPTVVWQGYSVHGNEPSGANASIVMAYYMAAAQGEFIDKMLSETVMLMDPVINPDGLARFAHWANMHVGKNLVTDPNHREHLEVWPNGRTNHYWFDLNRDWMPVQHPESRGRITKIHEWKPNIVNDFHEMGTNSSYFFQPGIPSRNFPLTPERTFELTHKIAEYHARELDAVGSLYYTKESFDDFYIGKGSTYPDLNGAIGILYEQGSSRGHAQESQYGVVHFPFTIRNQFLASVSTMKAAMGLRTELLEHQREFFVSAMREASNSTVKAYVFSDEHDPAKNWHLLDLLGHHDIDIYELDREVSVGGQVFRPGAGYVVPVEQKQFRFITSLFETRTSFTDSLFYDVSTWTLPLAFDIPAVELSSRAWNRSVLGAKVDGPGFPVGRLVSGDVPADGRVGARVDAASNEFGSAYSYAFEWDGYYAPRAANRLMDAGVKLMVAARPFESHTSDGSKAFDYGTILVPMGIQDDAVRSQVPSIINEIVANDAVTVFELPTGYSTGGIDLGSPNFNMLRKPSVMVLGGAGVSQNDVGELWHLLDQRWDLKMSIVETPRFNSISLDRYNVIILVNGNYSDMSSGAVEKLRRWVADGGTLVLHRGAIGWASRAGLVKVEFRGASGDDSSDDASSGGLKTYVELQAERGAQVIGGSIFKVDVDVTHPMFYGYRRPSMATFRNTGTMLEPPSNAYAMPMQYNADSPLLSGYISAPNLERIKGTAGIIVGGIGSGKVIMMTDNPAFRSFWFGTNKLVANSVFFGHTISGQATQR